jgi:chromatin assembly factor 1 subunit A
MSSQADPSPSASRKRSHDGELVNIGTPTPQLVVHMATDPPTSAPVCQSSPALSISSSRLALTELTPSNGKSPAPPTSSGSAQKKPKLTFAEREVERAVKKRENEEREKQKADEKARKEQERREKEEEREAAKRQREIEKAQRDAEKAKKEAEKSAKQKVKDIEKAKREAERLKKERVSKLVS